MTEEDQAGALLAAAISALDYGASEVAAILFRALLERYPLSAEATEALHYLRNGRAPRGVAQARDLPERRDQPEPRDDGA